MNPKIGLDISQPFGMNINIASPLLSRFDLVLHIKDKVDAEWDKMVTDYILNGQKDVCETGSDIWNTEMLQVLIGIKLTADSCLLDICRHILC